MNKKTNINTYNLISLAKKLFPINRSLTGAGLRATLKIIADVIPLKIVEIPSGTKVFDWTIPEEWEIDEAFVTDSNGNKIIDIKNNNLHLVSYSTPVNKKVSKHELVKHLHYLKDNPSAIPYRTSYFDKDWGFCLSYRDFRNLNDNFYNVHIESRFKKGSLTYGELLIKGRSDKQVIVFTHTCHPSLANDGVSGMVISTFLAKYLLNKKSKYSYRFIFAPTTIGAITWLAKNEKDIKNIIGGLVLEELGGPGKVTYKKSRRGNTYIDAAAAEILQNKSFNGEIIEFTPWGHEERQFCSPGINLPIGLITKTSHSEYPQYHNSLDNLSFIKLSELKKSFSAIKQIVDSFDLKKIYVNLYPDCEPQLGKRGIYKAMNTVDKDTQDLQKAMLYVLNFSDGITDLDEVMKKSKISTQAFNMAIRLLKQKKLIVEI